MQNLQCHSMGENTSEVVCTGDSGEQIEHCKLSTEITKML